MEILASRKEWDRLHGLADDVDGDIRVHYSMLHAMEEWESGHAEQAMHICVTHGVSKKAEFFAFYRALATTVLQSRESKQQEDSEHNLFSILHQ